MRKEKQINNSSSRMGKNTQRQKTGEVYLSRIYA